MTNIQRAESLGLLDGSRATVLSPSNLMYSFGEAHPSYTGSLSRLPRISGPEDRWISEKGWMVIYNIRPDKRFGGYGELPTIASSPEYHALMGNFGDHFGEGGWEAMISVADPHQTPHIIRYPGIPGPQTIEQLLRVDALRSAEVLNNQEGPIPLEVRDPIWLPAIKILKMRYNTQEFKKE